MWSPFLKRNAIQVTIFFAVYYIAGVLGQATTNIRSSNIGPVWPAYGVALAAFLVCGYRVWPAIALGAFVVALSSPVTPLAALGQAAGATLAAFSGAYLLYHILEFDRSLSRLRDALALVLLGALGSSLVSATIGVSVLYGTHGHAYSGPGSAWLIYWLGDSTGVLLVTPLVLTFPTLFRIRDGHRLREFAVLLLLLAATSFAAFGLLPLTPSRVHHLAFAVLPFVMWAGIRFGMSVTALSIFLLTTIATVETALGSGPFTTNTPLMNAVLLDIFFAVVSVTGLSLAAVVAEREHAEGERERLVRERAEAEARLRIAAVVESSDDAIASGTLDGTIASWNKGAQKMYGYTEAEAVGKPMNMLVPPELPDEENKILEMLKAGRRIEHFETVRVTKTGKRINVSLTVSPIKDSSGRTVGVSGIARDITERKRAEETLRESEERLRLAAKAGKMYAYEWDVATDVVVRSEESTNILGPTDEPSPLMRQQLLARVHPDDRAKFIAAVDDLKPESPTTHITYRFIRTDGSVIWLEKYGRAFFDPDGRMVRMIGMVADITERKRAEEALCASEERLRLAQQAARIGTFERNVRTGVLTWTPEMEVMYGLPPGDFEKTQTAFENLIHPDDRARVMELVDSALKTGQQMTGEWRVVWPDGSTHWIAGRWQVLMNEFGEPFRVVGVNMDVTERKRAEEELLEVNRTLEAQSALLQSSEELLKIFVKNVPAAVAMLDRDMRYLQVSDRWRADYFPGRAQILGCSHYEIFPDMPERWKEVHRRCLEGETVRADEDRWEGKDGPHWARWEVRPWKTAEGTVGGILILAEDITRRKQMEEAISGVSGRLIEAQERERGRIARDLHDDICQQLSLVSIELEQVERKLPDSVSEHRSCVGELRKRIMDISTDVQMMSHELHSAKLSYLGVAAAMKGFCREFGEHHRVQIEFESHDLPSQLPPDVSLCLFRVLQEALQNAAKHSGVKRFDVQLWGTSEDVHLTISDLGSGFDTEAAMKGRGLGITSMQERLKLVKGELTITSQPKSGTVIHALVPLGLGSQSARAAG